MLIVETAARLRRWAWIESRLFEVVGGWAAETPESEVAMWFATVAHHHAWRAGLWSERIPVLHDVAESPPPTDWAVLVEADAAASTATRLGALAEVVLPALLEEYEGTLAEVGEVADAPVARALHKVIPDVVEDRQAALELLALGA